jgi:hypothetical protein
MRDAERPVLPSVYSPTDEFWTYFLASLFRIQSLISIIEYIQSGKVDISASIMCRQVFRAEYTFFLQYDALWARSHASLYTVIGLLLSPHFKLSQDGTVTCF